MFRKLSTPGNVALEFCAGTCSKATTGVLLDQHRASVSYGGDCESSVAAEKDLMLDLACQVLFLRSCITGSCEKKASGRRHAVTKLLKYERVALLLWKRKKSVRNLAWAGLCEVHVGSKSSLYFSYAEEIPLVKSMPASFFEHFGRHCDRGGYFSTKLKALLLHKSCRTRMSSQSSTPCLLEGWEQDARLFGTGER